MTELKDLNILKKLLQFEKPISKFHEAMHAFICNNFISKDEEKKLRALFRYVDKNDKNALSAEDFQRCFREIKIFLSIKEINDILKLIDSNQNAIIEYQEFLRATCDRNILLSKDNLKNAFMALTEGGDKSYIDANDIKKFIFHDLNIQDDIFSEYLDQFGMKKDEKIDFEQFCDMLKNNKKLHEDISEKPKIEEKKITIITRIIIMIKIMIIIMKIMMGKKCLKKLNLKEYKLLK
jgi:Ca2+-binding EF-hand superfamily protein